MSKLETALSIMTALMGGLFAFCPHSSIMTPALALAITISSSVLIVMAVRGIRG